MTSAKSAPRFTVEFVRYTLANVRGVWYNKGITKGQKMTRYTVTISKYGDGSQRVTVSDQLNKASRVIEQGGSVGEAFLLLQKFLRGE